VVDWGSGGGLPAIPLAIVWPDIEILAVDSNGKKTRAVDLFCRRLGIKNCRSWHGRAEQAEGSFHYSVSRATAPLADLWQWHQRVETSPSNLEVEVPSSNVWAPGLICLKGGDLQEEIRVMNHKFPDLETRVQPLALLKHDSYFETKCLVHVQKCGT
jgi:16S rRNA (guanine527-N7)-methyltransferase